MTHPVHGRRQLLIWVAVLLVAGVFGAVWTINALNSRTDLQEQRADQAVYTAVQLCEQVRQLGGACVVDPSVLRGAQGETGPRGPGPTDEQIAVAVAVWLRANPPSPGRAPTDGEIAAATTAYLAANPPAPGAQGAQGERGEQGPQGVPASDEQIAAAVAAWLRANPPPYCPAGSHAEEYNPPLDKRTFIVCVKEKKG